MARKKKPPPAAEKPQKKAPSGYLKASYDTKKARTRERDVALSESGRDIGEIPPIVKRDRRDAGRHSFRLFCESYMPATFELAWSPDHLEVIAAVEAAVLRGELLAFAMPRGSGKTSLVEAAALWALLYGHRDFVAIVGSDEGHAAMMLQSVQVECETNELLLEDFPEAIYPIVALERIHQRAKGQLFQGKPTHIRWTSDELQFPSIPGSPAAGGIIRVAGITGQIRGMSAKRASDGRKVRPGLVLIDDPQTDDSARSPSQVANRESVIRGAILGLAGPRVRIAGLATVTVIWPDDLAERLLNRERNPAFQGKRFSLVQQWPKNATLWEEYAELRRRGQRTGAGTAEATAFYARNREAMDEGGIVSWAERKNDDELSAIQHAWNLRIDRGEAAFFAEYQNQPLEMASEAAGLKVNDTVAKAVKIDRWIVPSGLDTLTVFVDVQQTVLYWLVAAWGHRFRGHVVAYGAYPDQGRSYFTLRETRRTLQREAGVDAIEPAIHAGLGAVATMLLEREFARENDDAVMRVSHMLIDANWAQTQGVVRDFARRSKWGPRIIPTHGRFVGASSSTISDKAPDRGERVGFNWRTSTIQKQKHLLYDTNAWKSFVASRIRLPVGDPQGLTLHEGQHDMLAEQFASEHPVRVTSRQRIVDEWRLTPGRDNHLWDCLVGAAVAASFSGISDVGTESEPAVRRQAVSSEEARRRREEIKRRFG